MGAMSRGAPSMYDALMQENLRLSHENMLMHAMQENARLARENALLRMQSQVMPPPGLEAQAPLPCLREPREASPVQGHITPPKGKSRRCPLSSTTEASTTPGSSPPCSLSHSRQSSLGDESTSEKCQDRTSVMMRNLPNNLTRDMLLDMLRSEGYDGCFDFVYLPIDFQSNSGLGYAFINLTTHDVAVRFCDHFTGFNHWSLASEKVCHVTWSDSLQGREAHIERYRNSPVMHESVPEDHKPLIFAGLDLETFPGPTKKLRAPRRWHRRH